MRSIASLFVFLAVMSVAGLMPAAEAQSTLNFPRQFTPTELQSTGFAVANPNMAEAGVLFTLYSDLGTTVASATLTVPAGGQLAKLGSELFVGAAGAGWVQATSSAPGLTGFWLGGDFATFTDGAEASPSGTSMVLPLVTGQTQISIVNISAGTNNVRIRLIGADGTDIAADVTQAIAKMGVFQAQASAIFPAANFAQAMYVSLSGDAFTTTAVVRGFVVPTETAVLNGVDGSTSGARLFFAHVINGAVGGARYSTVIGVTNLSSTVQTVTLSFNPEPTGAPIAVQRSLPPGGALRDTAQNIFGLPGDFRDGWVQVAGSLAITGFVAYGDTVAGGLAVVPPQPAPRGSMLFAHVAGLPTWYTGIALLNASDTDANIEVTVLDQAGTLIGSVAKFNIAAKHKTAKLLSELIPQANAQNGGFVIVRTSIPLYGLQLFGGTNGKILSNIASGRPSPSAPTATPNPLLASTNLGRLTLDNVEWDASNPHNCTETLTNCFVPRPGYRVLRIRLNLFDRTPESIGQDEVLGVLQFVTLSGSNFAPVSPFVLGAVQGPPASTDTSVTYTGGLNVAIVTVPATPPYNVVYVGFEVPANATAVRLNWIGTATLDLGF